MKPLMAGCLVAVGLFLLCTGVVAAVFYLVFPPTSQVYGVEFALLLGASGLFFSLAPQALRGSARNIGDMRLLRNAAHPSADGARVAVCGRLVADGPLLAAPMTGRPSVTYKYEVTTRNSQRRLGVACDGYALTPCHVDTPGGSIRILGYTDFRFSPETPSGPDAESRMREYLAGTTLTPHGLSAGRAFLAMLVDEDGAIRADFGIVPALDAGGFTEHAVADREEVCAFGTYSAERGGLVPRPGSVDAYPVSLRRGSAARIRRSLLTGAAGYLGLAAFLAALGAVAAWLLTRL